MQEEATEKMKKILNYGFVIVMIFITAWIFFKSGDLSQIPRMYSDTNKYYLMLGVLCMIGFWICDATVIYSMKKMMHLKGNITKSFKLTMIGQYFSSITPFASGGQPAQVYSMVKDSIPVGKATSVLINKFVIYQIVVTLYSIVMFILKVSFVYSRIKVALPFVMTGIILNFVGLIVISGLFFNDKIIKKISLFVLKFLKIIRIIKDVHKYESKLDRDISDYMCSIKKIMENKWIALRIVFVTILQLTFHFSITYFIYLALGFKSATFLDIISIQSLLYMAVSFIPTPGTAGAAEGGFFILFNVFFSGNVLMYAILLWRIISYYLNIMVSGSVTLVDYIIRTKKKIVIEK